MWTSAESQHWTDVFITVGNGDKAFYKVTAVDSQSQESVKSDYDWIQTNRSSKLVEQIDSRNFNFALFNNYPNPFNPVTTIDYSIKYDGNVSLAIYDVLGRQITTLVNEKKPAGNHSVEFNASNLPSGVYIYKLSSGNFVATKKLILMK